MQMYQLRSAVFWQVAARATAGSIAMVKLISQRPPYGDSIFRLVATASGYTPLGRVSPYS